LASSGFSFDTGRFRSPVEMDKRLNRAIFGVAKYYDGRMEAYAKQKAPWKDRTSNARNGLHAEAVKLQGTGFAANSFAIILSHAVTYGIYLELPHTHERDRGGAENDVSDGSEGGTYTVPAYPIIMPTINHFAPKVMRTLNKILDRL